MGNICSLLCKNDIQDQNNFITNNSSNSKNKTPEDVNALLQNNNFESSFSTSPIQTPLLTSVNFDIARDDQMSTDSSIDDKEIEQLLEEEENFEKANEYAQDEP